MDKLVADTLYDKMTDSTITFYSDNDESPNYDDIPSLKERLDKYAEMYNDLYNGILKLAYYDSNDFKRMFRYVMETSKLKREEEEK